MSNKLIAIIIAAALLPLIPSKPGKVATQVPKASINLSSKTLLQKPEPTHSKPPEAPVKPEPVQVTAPVATVAPTPAPQPTQPVVAPTRSEAEYKALIYSHESGNDPTSVNKKSGACGIGQSLPCSKVLSACPTMEYSCQDAWFTNSYMIPRYGTWAKAWAYWNCTGYCTNNYGTVYKDKTWW